MVDFNKLLKKHRETQKQRTERIRVDNALCREMGVEGPMIMPPGYFEQQRKRQAAVEYPDTCPEFWAIELAELDAEGPHHVKFGHV